ncbi:uncharacterized protein LOC112598928 [Melanaphis sacchari]|uniref:uncharacterized protein LOC112598928 n=1 Tax=Melanaphis sacchari TaxID=742174 RepID=UPI000DC135BE|nr:uncharacterized protein LOC112598928 [Melanaphis sacchari]
MVGVLKSDIDKVTTAFSTLLSAENSQSEELDSTNYINIKHSPIVNKPVLGDVWNVYISNINSLKYFHVQNIENFEYIQSISSELDKYESTSKKLPKVGNLIAARDYNGFWYRARVQSITELGFYVCYIDFGVSNVLVTDFKTLPKKLISVKPMAYCCYFKNVSKEDENKLSVLDLFDSIYKFYSSHQITATFLSNNDPYLVELSCNGNNVLDILYNLVWNGIVPSISDDPINLEKFKLLNEIFPNSRKAVVCIEPVFSINHFYVETESSYKIGEDIRTEIENQTKWIPVLYPEEGQIVIAKNTVDLKLYRARVIMKYDNCEEYKCFLIDCMTFENCSEIFEPSDYLRIAPPVKIHCSLDMPKKYSGDMLESINLAFINEIAECIDESKVIHIKIIGDPCVIDLEIGDVDIYQIIRPCDVRVINALNFNSLKVRLSSPGEHKILNVLQSTKKFRTVSNPEVFKLYVAKIKTKYKRVKYMGEHKLSFKVKLVDEVCIHQKIIVDELYELPKTIINVKTIDLFCSLGLNTISYSNELFVDICNNSKTKFKMVVIKNNHFKFHTVKLFLGSKDITSMICNQPL